jgi:hypothetical protein
MATGGRAAPVSNRALWAGRVISGVVVLFMLFDGTIKLILYGGFKIIVAA